MGQTQRSAISRCPEPRSRRSGRHMQRAAARTRAVLIHNAEIEGAPASLRITGGQISEIGTLERHPNEQIIDARGGALLPGLHDHHLHLFALAARQASVLCGPPAVTSLDELARQLQRPGSGWLRGLGYHESVAGMLDSEILDRIACDRPIRIQHRGGRMWFLNSVAISELLGRAPAPPGLEHGPGGYTGRLFEEDKWLRQTLGGGMPGLGEVSTMLASFGLTGVTEMSPDNDQAVASHLIAEQAGGSLSQTVYLAGGLSLGESLYDTPLLSTGPYKIHLHEAVLPDHDQLVQLVRCAHDQGRNVAAHCTTEVELVYALSAIEEGGAWVGDRIEHASLAPDHLVAEIARLGLSVVTQPNFVHERGDAYRADLPPEDWPALYRLRSWLDAGVPLAAGSDAPFGLPDPWAAMQAAVCRLTASGAALGAGQALTPEEALALYLADPADLTRQRRIRPGARADLCLLDRSWAEARNSLSAGLVRTTFIGGLCVHDRIDQPPFECGLRTDSLA